MYLHYKWNDFSTFIFQSREFINTLAYLAEKNFHIMLSLALWNQEEGTLHAVKWEMKTLTNAQICNGETKFWGKPTSDLIYGSLQEMKPISDTV